ncbi:DUF2157 domain-containing protein [Aestuariirhabdus sp. Z084]|uniref:DUF2157 domain-containing protein n=1 Tax=Aestuariirhabdus haliotis TaxID=2918751 RepID=UPI00201B4416|nr:DUF2157 domain-containing protein [Aestuariirhabdus haliotis]MCL6414653.1 DUF2157 domain-containing protein [Aestuariirhabdus haliotis]MCL6418365.1 DUF2157 domain-containing protein [Aestuariirhabdus haliotis]
MSEEFKQQRLRPRDLFVLYEQKRLDSETLASGIADLQPVERWTLWLSRQMLLCGTALLLAGIFYLLAFNWELLGRFSRHAVMLTLFGAATVLALYLGPSRLGGNLAALAATVLSGAWLAVIGQIYQTGADAWQLFATWTLLCALWLPGWRFAPLWAFCWLLLNLSICLYWFQVLQAPGASDPIGLFASLGSLNLLALIGFETQCQRPWLAQAQHWLRHQLIMLTLFFLTFPAMTTFLEPEATGVADWLLLLVWGAVLIAGYIHYHPRHLGIVALLQLSLISALMPAAGRLLLDHGNTLGYWGFALLLILAFGGAAWWLSVLAGKSGGEQG